MADSIGSLNVKLVASTDGLARDLNHGARLVKKFDKDVAQTGKANPGKQLTQDFRTAERASRSAGVSIGKAFAGGFVGAVAAMGAGDILGGIKDLAVGGVGLAAEFEKTKVAFDTMLGSGAKADAMLKEIRGFAAESPLTFDDAARGAKQLLAFGIEADQTVGTLRMLSDVAAGTGTELSQLTNAYGQVATAGRLMGTELLQFTQAGVPIIDELGKVLGKPKTEIKQLVEQGKVGFPEVVKAFKSMTEAGGKFDGMTEKFGKTFAGQVEQLKDAADQAKAALGKALIEELDLKGATRDLGRFVDKAKGFVNDIRPGLNFLGAWGRTAVSIYSDVARVFNTGFKSAKDLIGALIPQLRDADGLARSWMGFLKNAASNAVRFADVQGRIVSELARELPRLGFLDEALKDFKRFIEGDFKIDKVKLAEGFFEAGRMVIDVIGPIGDAIESIGERIDTYIIQPFKLVKSVLDENLVRVKAIVDLMKLGMGGPAKLAGLDVGKVIGDAAGDVTAIIDKEMARRGVPGLADAIEKYDVLRKERERNEIMRANADEAHRLNPKVFGLPPWAMDPNGNLRWSDRRRRDLGLVEQRVMPGLHSEQFAESMDTLGKALLKEVNRRMSRFGFDTDDIAGLFRTRPGGVRVPDGGFLKDVLPKDDGKYPLPAPMEYGSLEASQLAAALAAVPRVRELELSENLLRDLLKTNQEQLRESQEATRQLQRLQETIGATPKFIW